tara:strand:+ start:8922 stop:9368 length:447 start_codon:yes stop_codon:yes gene_type:complete
MAVSGAPTTGHGATIAFAASGFNSQMTSIGGGESTRESIETTNLNYAGDGKTFIPSDLIDNGEKEIEFYYQRNKRPPITGLPEVITVTYPLNHSVAADGTIIVASGRATEAFLGFITNFGRPQLVSEEVQKATATIKISGDITYTDET